jgi:hypothetical protein
MLIRDTKALALVADEDEIETSGTLQDLLKDLRLER